MNTTETFIFSPVLPWWLLLPAGLCFVWGLWRTYAACPLSPSRRIFLCSCRIAAFLVLTWLLLLPSRREKTVEMEKPVLAVAVDVSASMTDNPSAALRTRAQRAVDFLNDSAVRRRLKDYRVRYFCIGSGIRENEGTFSEKDFTDYRSFLKSGLNGAADRLRAENVAAMIFLSDGLDQGDEELSPRFASIPIFIPFLENPVVKTVSLQDFSLENLSAPSAVARNWEAEITADIRRRGGASAQQFAVVLREGEQELRRSEVRFEQNQLFRKVEFSYRGETVGTHLLSIQIEPTEDAVAENNRRDLVIEVQDGEKNILYLEGVPRWEFKFLKRSLLNEQNQKLHACLQAGNGAFISFAEGSGPRTIPEFTEKNLAEYRLVILGELNRSAFPEKKAEILAEFVKKGGALLLLGGSRIYSSAGVAACPALRKLLPGTPEDGGRMQEGRFAVQFTGEALTRKGLAELAGTGNFPPVLSLWGPVRKGPFAGVWLEAADGSPVLLTGRAGEGRVAMIFSDSLWRWQLGASSAGEEKSLYAGLMTQLVEWLIPGSSTGGEENELGIRLPRAQAVLYESLIIQALPGKNISREGISCRIRTPSGRDLVFPVAREKKSASGEEEFFCRYVPDQAGVYQIEFLNQEGVRSRTAMLPVMKPEFEFTGASYDRKALFNIAAETGGECAEWQNRENLLRKLPGQMRRYESVREYPVWNHWGYLVLLMLFFTTEWAFRRKWDLV